MFGRWQAILKMTPNPSLIASPTKLWWWTRQNKPNKRGSFCKRTTAMPEHSDKKRNRKQKRPSSHVDVQSRAEKRERGCVPWAHLPYSGDAVRRGWRWVGSRVAAIQRPSKRTTSAALRHQLVASSSSFSMQAGNLHQLLPNEIDVRWNTSISMMLP